METLYHIFGHQKVLDPFQMSMRAIAISIIALGLIRFSGRRAFGMGTAIDNVFAILVGAILSRTVVGASPFLSTIAAATTIAVLHRMAVWIGLYSRFFGKIIKGDAIVVFEKGKLNEANMKRCRISERDLMEGIRLTASTESFEQIETVYVERNGKISVIKKS